MSQTGYLIIAIAIIVVLALVTVISFVTLKKMPVKEGYQDHHPSQSKCGPCAELGCPFYAKFHNESEDQ